jgi:hypothetical protein
MVSPRDVTLRRLRSIVRKRVDNPGANDRFPLLAACFVAALPNRAALKPPDDPLS